MINRALIGALLISLAAVPAMAVDECKPPNVARTVQDWPMFGTESDAIHLPVLHCPTEGVCYMAPEYASPPSMPAYVICLTPGQEAEAEARHVRAQSLGPK